MNLWLSLLSLQWERTGKSNAWMENQLAWSPCKGLHPGMCALTGQRIKGDLEWG